LGFEVWGGVVRRQLRPSTFLPKSILLDDHHGCAASVNSIWLRVASINAPTSLGLYAGWFVLILVSIEASHAKFLFEVKLIG
jgi:hypothetical protein